MNQASIRAHAKINLTLDVVGRRPDGYHNVCMVMQSIGLHDEVRVVRGADGIVLRTNRRELEIGDDNLAVRAAKLFFAETGTGCDGVEIFIQKNIPIAAGLAGGSTNAAAVLVLLDVLYGTKLSRERLMALGLRLGADVPFCLTGGTMLAEGIGERLTALPPAPQTQVLLCKPPVAVSTPAIYRAMDAAIIRERPDTEGMLRALWQDARAVARKLCNVMQPVTATMHPEIDMICQVMRAHGALGAAMSGSGPTCFGLFDRREAAQAAYAALRTRYADTCLTDFCTAGQVRM